MIPRILHTIWLGNEQSKFDYRQKWMELNPGWSFVHWTEELIELMFTEWPFPDLVSKSDYYRLLILNTYGGIYVDMDVEPLKPFEDLRRNEFFVGLEDKKWLCPAVMGSVKRFGLLIDCIQYARQHSHKLVVPWGPKIITKLAPNYPQITVYSKNTFYPYHYDDLIPMDLDVSKSYAVHHWNSTRNGFK